MSHNPAPETRHHNMASTLLPRLIWTTLTVAIFIAGWKLAQSGHVVAKTESAPPLPALPPRMGQLTLSIPKEGGFWLNQPNYSTSTLVRQANASGLPQFINLCQQRKNRPDAPDQIYPIRLTGDWAALNQHSTTAQGKIALRSPLVVAPELSKGMPRIVIEGDYQGQLRASVLPGPETAEFTLAFATVSKQAFLLSGENWLLWNTRSEMKPTASSGQFFRHAIRIRRLAGTGTNAGDNGRQCSDSSERLEWQLFTAAPPGDDKTAAPARLANVSIQSGKDAPIHLRLSAGEHALASANQAQLEDKALFERAQAQGLIRLGTSGMIEWAPADLPRLDHAGQLLANWKEVNLSQPEVMATHKALYRSANGQFVRTQLQNFNSSRQWLALRVRPMAGPTNAGEWSQLSQWQAQAENQNLRLSHTMPAVVARLFATLPTGWGDWIRVAHWPLASSTGLATEVAKTNQVSMRVALPASAHAGQGLEVLVLGKLLAVQGGRLVSNVPACHGNACPAADLITLAQIEIGEGPLILTLAPEPRFEQLRPDAAEFARVQMRRGKLAWVSPPTSVGGAGKAEVSIQARDGTPLFAQNQASAQAYQMGLAELVGLNTAHTHGVAGVLGRMGQHGVDSVQARLTIAPEWQMLAEKILDCVGLREGEWDAKSGVCQDENAPKDIPAKRRAAMVWLNAENGDILAAASAPHAPQGVTPADLIAFDRFNPGASPLRVNAWQHDGRSEHNPGSTFKLIDALALEQWAAGRPERQTLLAGQSMAQLNSLGSELGFSMQANCYPAPCSRNTIPNFRLARPVESAVAGQFGLEQALKKSVNTWFAWMVERSDASSAIAPDALPLGASALNEARPVLAMARRLGFEQSQQLDGGLLPADFAWAAQDHLQTIASHLEPIGDVHKIRLQSIGQRVQATTLQMAQVSAAIASGHLVKPRLLASLNGVNAQDKKGEALGVELVRIRRGMKEVVASGTAAGAFNTPGLKGLAAGVYGKTGTAQASNPGGDAGQDHDTVWFVGYVQAGTLANQPHALAFAVSVSYGHRTGGGHAAKVVGGVLESMRGGVK